MSTLRCIMSLLLIANITTGQVSQPSTATSGGGGVVQAGGIASVFTVGQGLQSTVHGFVSVYSTLLVEQPTFPPPRNLVVDITESGNVSLQWGPPIFNPTEDIPDPVVEALVFDDGTPGGSYTWTEGAKMGSRLSPSWPCKILELQFYHGTPGLFTAGIFEWTGTAPGSELLEIDASSTAVGWVTVDVSSYDIQVNSDFIVANGMQNATVSLGFDTDGNGRAWDWNGTTWSAWNETYFVRAIVQELESDQIASISSLSATDESVFLNTAIIEQKGYNDINSAIASMPASNYVLENRENGQFSHYKIYRGSEISGSYDQQFSQIMDTVFVDTTVEENRHYYYTVSAIYVNPQGESNLSNEVEVHTPVAIDRPGSNLQPLYYSLVQNFPNPFNPSTTIRYGIPDDSHVSMVIYDIQGREITRLVNDLQVAGWYDFTWNGTNSDNIQVGTGLYIARIKAGHFTDVIKMVYLR